MKVEIKKESFYIFVYILLEVAIAIWSSCKTLGENL